MRTDRRSGGGVEYILPLNKLAPGIPYPQETLPLDTLYDVYLLLRLLFTCRSNQSHNQKEFFLKILEAKIETYRTRNCKKQQLIDSFFQKISTFTHWNAICKYCA